MRRYRFDWKLSLLLVILLPLLLRLGFWQLSREEEKLALQANWQARQAEVPVALQQLDAGGDLQYRQVELEGRFDNAHVFLLDNQVHDGQVGVDVIQPFITAQQSVVFVNRGWLAQGSSRATLPAPPLLNETVRLQGTVYVPVGEQFVLGDIAPGADWPKLMQTLDISELAQLSSMSAEHAVFPYSVRLAEGTPGVLQRNWSVISTTPEKHRGYAVQWFAMALALVLLYLYYSFSSSFSSSFSRDDERQ